MQEIYRSRFSPRDTTIYDEEDVKPTLPPIRTLFSPPSSPELDPNKLRTRSRSFITGAQPPHHTTLVRPFDPFLSHSRRLSTAASRTSASGNNCSNCKMQSTTPSISVPVVNPSHNSHSHGSSSSHFSGIQQHHHRHSLIHSDLGHNRGGGRNSSEPPVVSQDGIHFEKDTFLDWDDILGLLVGSTVATFLPSGHPLNLAVTCLNMAETWKQSMQDELVQQNHHQQQQQQQQQQQSRTGIYTPLSSSSNNSFSIPPSVPFNSTSSSLPPTTSGHRDNQSQSQKSQNSDRHPLERSTGTGSPSFITIPHPTAGGTTTTGSSTNSKQQQGGPPPPPQPPSLFADTATSLSMNGMPTPTSAVAPNNDISSPHLTPPINSTTTDSSNKRTTTQSHSPIAGTSKSDTAIELTTSIPETDLEVLWDTQLGRPSPPGSAEAGNPPNPESERIRFNPKHYFRVFRSGVEVFPWDGVGPGNDWLRGQLIHQNECRCGTFHFRHTNAGFKRPAVLREHLAASCASSTAIPEPLKRLCNLQREAEKQGTKRKREESGFASRSGGSGGGGGNKRSRVVTPASMLDNRTRSVAGDAGGGGNNQMDTEAGNVNGTASTDVPIIREPPDDNGSGGRKQQQHPSISIEYAH